MGAFGMEAPETLTPRVQACAAELGILLDASSAAALATLPEVHAIELLGSVADKVASGHIKNPSNYVVATISRGYVPKAAGGAQAYAYQVHTTGKGGSPQNADDMAAAHLAASHGMVVLQQANIQLRDEAMQALLTLPTEHASQLLEQVASKTGIRDPSNYVCATVAKGYLPQETALFGQPPPPSTPHPYLNPGWGTEASSFKGEKGRGTEASSFKGEKGRGTEAGSFKGEKGLRPETRSDGGKSQQASTGPALVPPDATQLEMAVLDLNAQDLWQSQRVDANSLLALRCVSEEQALGLLGSLYAKGAGKGKGSVNIGNLNNYIQAAVKKIMKAESTGSSLTWNTTGNQTRQKAAELGLFLEDTALQALAQVPLRASLDLLNQAAEAMTQGEDPSLFIIQQASSSPGMDGGPTKKARWQK